MDNICGRQSYSNNLNTYVFNSTINANDLHSSFFSVVPTWLPLPTNCNGARSDPKVISNRVQVWFAQDVSFLT